MDLKIEVSPSIDTPNNKLVIAVVIAIIRGLGTTISYLKKALRDERL